MGNPDADDGDVLIFAGALAHCIFHKLNEGHDTLGANE